MDTRTGQHDVSLEEHGEEWEVPASLVNFLIQCGLDTPQGQAVMKGFRLGHSHLARLPADTTYVIESVEPSNVIIRVSKGA